MAKWDMESYLPLILYLNMKKNWRSRFIPKSYNEICIGHVFAHICYVLKELARTDIYLELTLILLLMVLVEQLKYQGTQSIQVLHTILNTCFIENKIPKI